MIRDVVLPVARFARVAVTDAFGQAPPPDQDSQRHLDATLEWLIRAQDRTVDGGVSYGYSLRGGWKPPYRETSGYILTTFFRAADALARPDLADRAVRIARWLLSVQNADGSFANPQYGDEGIVFDTGQDLFGLVAAYERTGDEAFRAAAVRAGQWLVDTLGEDPMWRRHEHKRTPHVYNTRTAWALLRLHQIEPAPQWVQAARTNLDWALSMQQESGFFAANAFEFGDVPYTHNISYAICGLQESGWLLDDARYVDAARRCSDAALALMRPDGFIPGQITHDGDARAGYSCLTGQCQLAIVWAKQYLTDADPRYRAAALASLDFVKRHHTTTGGPAATRGAVAGSAPIWGRYAPWSYPNWAAKFFTDALLLERLL